MVQASESESRKLLVALRDAMAEDSAGQARLDKIVQLTAHSMGSEVCSIYLFRDSETLELCATQGLNAVAVHQTKLRIGEGLVGRKLCLLVRRRAEEGFAALGSGHGLAAHSALQFDEHSVV